MSMGGKSIIRYVYKCIAKKPRLNALSSTYSIQMSNVLGYDKPCSVNCHYSITLHHTSYPEKRTTKATGINKQSQGVNTCLGTTCHGSF